MYHTNLNTNNCHLSEHHLPAHDSPPLIDITITTNHHKLKHPLEDCDNYDVIKHLEILKTRLGFARFKLKNGWEKNALPDVEGMWKQRQKQIVDQIPTPRMTQRDIIEKRVYIQSPGARSAQTKKARLTRSLSNPTELLDSKDRTDSLTFACATAAYKTPVRAKDDSFL
ncbi:hypothetical protein J3Q64DRAFT_1682105 [Phycomyces blakesleeanus]|uniref:Uncharacterized protein n=2 Tax=Phycomyces blakesleeanus TaxID=4837 RepID=A0A167KU16_PHYB8|nr:hypothetical protein PHYBLDRAFT_159968 [Phycomyces blakesleeanus NRRL 1555(-)]OAD68886.1 hypothetical protein PHYBLDRAFT_159968 [Phycomyces blakesleeanus NRRL 1555(-)]|eukprot:XP_018286926.1 hypothetical protein PHYBLDRAFT_159968 [Phycomyces blakesleeanus NRRL 1555(-)]